jgi:hypothetical protein
VADTQAAALEVLRHELVYRRDKQWKIFRWTATVLIASIGGVISLAGQEQFRFPWFPQRIAMAAALIVVTVYACRWIAENIQLEAGARDALVRCLNGLGLDERSIPSPLGKPVYAGYVTLLILLAVAAVITVLLAPAA